MPVLSDEDKLERFKSSVMEAANSEAAAILDEVAAKKESMLAEGCRSIDAEAAEWLDGELKALNRKNARQYALESTKLRENQLLGREAVIDEIITRARAKLADYVKTEAYGERLAGICVEVARTRGESFTVYLSQTDTEKYKLPILRALEDFQEQQAIEVGYTEHVSPVYTVVPDREIKLGGAKFLSAEGGVFINETLDEYLRLGRERLTKLVGESVQ